MELAFSIHSSSEGDVDSPGSGSRSVARKRHGGPRSKTGCITCRIRHVKCDEKKPACDRCTKTGRNCDGYQRSPWQVVDAKSMATMVQVSSDPRAASDPMAGRCFKVFETLTTTTLSGIFESGLWKEVLRAAQHDDTLWYAATALGSAHELYLQGNFDMSTYDEDKAMRFYTKAIRSLTKSDSEGSLPPADIVMVASILFMAFEMMRREYGKAINHIKAGIGIFSQRNQIDARRSPTDGYISNQHLEDVLRHLEISLCELNMEGRPSMPRTNLMERCVLPQPSEQWCMPSYDSSLSPFENIPEARRELDGYWHHLMFLLHEMAEPHVFTTTLSQDEMVARYDEFNQVFRIWKVRFDNFVAKLFTRPEPLGHLERQALAQMEMHQLAGYQLIETCLVPGEMKWDDYQRGLEHMLDLSEIIASSPDEGPRYKGFQIDQGLVLACFHSGWKCRAARVRQRTIDLLAVQRQEGLWDGDLVRQVIQHVDDFERGPGMLEEAAQRDAPSSEIPVWRRVMGIDVVFSSGGRHALITFHVPKSQEEPDIIEIRKTLSW